MNAGSTGTPVCLRGRDQSDRHWGIASQRWADGRTSVAAAGDVEYSHVQVAVDVGGIDEDLEETNKGYVVSCALDDRPRRVVVDGQRDDRSTGSDLASRRQWWSTGYQRITTSGENLKGVGVWNPEGIGIEVVLPAWAGHVREVPLMDQALHAGTGGSIRIQR